MARAIVVPLVIWGARFLRKLISKASEFSFSVRNLISTGGCDIGWPR